MINKQEIARTKNEIRKAIKSTAANGRGLAMIKQELIEVVSGNGVNIMSILPAMIDLQATGFIQIYDGFNRKRQEHVTWVYLDDEGTIQ